MKKEENKMTVATPVTQGITDVRKRILEQAKENLRDENNRKEFFFSGGSVKTKNQIDSQEICQEVRGKL